MSYNPLPTKSYQIDEDDDDPIIKVIPGPPLKREDLEYYASDGYYHFKSPNETIGFGVPCPITCSIPPKHPETIPPAVYAFWDFVCNIERLGLGATWKGWPTMDDLLLEVLGHYQAWEEQLQDRPGEMRMMFHICTANYLSCLASPLRRRIPQYWLRTLEGGIVPEEETKVFPMVKGFDILTREIGIKVSPIPRGPTTDEV
jgi:hypothetical protein